MSEDEAAAVQAEKDKRGAFKRSQNGMKACNWWDAAKGCYCDGIAGYSSTRADGLFRCRKHGGSVEQINKSRGGHGLCPAAHLPRPEGAPPCRNNAGNMAHGKYKGVEMFKGKCCNGTCAAAVAKALYQKEHDGIDYPEGFVPPKSAA